MKKIGKSGEMDIYETNNSMTRALALTLGGANCVHGNTIMITPEGGERIRDFYKTEASKNPYHN